MYMAPVTDKYQEIDVNEASWWFSIIDMTVKLTASNGSITGYKKDANGQLLLFTYDTDKKAIVSANDKIKSFVTDEGNINVVINASSINEDGEAEVISPIPFSIVNHPELTDGYLSTSFEFGMIADQGWTLPYIPRVSYHALLSIKPNKDYDYENISEAYMACCMDVQRIDDFGGDIYPLSVAYRFEAFDVYGRIYNDSKVDTEKLFDIDTTSSPVWLPFDMIPRDYFKATNQTPNYIGGEVITDISNEIVKRISLCEFPKTILEKIKIGAVSRINFIPKFHTSDPVTEMAINVRIKEVGFWTIKSVGTINEDIYASINGEKTGTSETSNVYTAFKHILEDYDGISSSTIDYDNIVNERSDWPVARQITDQKNSYDYLKELAEQSFVCIYPTRTGKRKLTAWREKDIITSSYDQLSINRDTIESIKRTEIKDLYNEYSLQYNYNPITKKYERSFTITSIDSNNFPDGTNWYPYVQGVNPGSRADASAFWTLSHSSYTKSHAIQKCPDNLSKLPWYYDSESIYNSSSPGLSTNNSVFKYMDQLVQWCTRQKDMMSFSVPLTATNLQKELLDNVSVSDIIYTDSTAISGWITGIEIKPDKNIINMDITLDPISPEESGLIVERGQILNVNTISESGSQPDTIKES